MRLFLTLHVPVILLLLTSRLFLTYANWFTIRVLDFAPRWGHEAQGSVSPERLWIGGWVRWDSWHYLIVAVNGYDPDQSGLTMGGAAFFPAYPMLMRIGAAAMGQPRDAESAAVAGLLISNVCFLAALLLLADLIRRAMSVDVARTTAFLFCLFPTSLFFSAVYTESLFLFAAVMSFWAASHQRWVVASLAIVLAGATRLFGLALIPAVLWMAYRRHESASDLAKIMLISPWGTLGYFIFLWRAYGDPFAYFHAQSNWGGWEVAVGKYLEIIQHTPGQMITEPLYNIIVAYVGMAVAFIVLLPMVWRRVDSGIAIFTSIVVIFHFLYTWNSLGRYMLGAIGCFIVVGLLLNSPKVPRWVEPLTLGSSAILLTLYSVLFANGFWVI